MKKFISALICVCLLSVFPQKACALSVSAQSAVLIEAESGKIIYEKDAHTRRGMASTTKIMTALCAIESLPLDTVVTVPQEAAGVEGSSVYLKAGEKLTLENLLYALMLQSANDAAAAVAIATAGSIEGFAELMNAKAAELGLRDTHFENPHGLDGAEHYTTAYELAKIAAHALENEDFARIVSTVKHTVPATESSPARTLVNHNRLLRTYDDIVGVKTGFTKKCGRTLVSAAEREGVRLICVTLNDG
ncbi:MAG: D-alanyl-D-alanine carboxypeptidase, partial [Clostridia bacterium]|nr:D-alanyl-D-alanine carboxypeptidase [Clostridia bacterium]